MAAEIRQFYKPQKLQSVQPLVPHSKALYSAGPLYRKVNKCAIFFHSQKSEIETIYLYIYKQLWKGQDPWYTYVQNHGILKFQEGSQKSTQGRFIF